MPDIRNIADYVTTVLPTFERDKYDSVSLRQKFPDYEIRKQMIAGRKLIKQMSDTYETVLETSSTSNAAPTFIGQPVTSVHQKIDKLIQSRVSGILTKAEFNDDFIALMGTDKERILNRVQQEFNKMEHDYWELEELSLLQSNPGQSPNELNGVLYWVSNGASVTDFDPNGGDDPESGGAGGITKSEEGLWPNAVGVFDTVTPDDYFDLIAHFLNRVKTTMLVPHPAVTSEVPNRIVYTQDPVQRAIGRQLQAMNDNVGRNAGEYRDMPEWNGVVFSIWHAMSSPASTVRPSASQATSLLVDWASMHYVVNSAINMLVEREKVSEVPGQHLVTMRTYRLLHCTARDRNMYMRSTNPNLLPDSV